jgi:hypothetical protein
MFAFDPHAYGPVVSRLIESEPLCPLGPGRPDETKRSLLAKLQPSDLHPGRNLVDVDMARCCLAGLWLLFDLLDESHAISQEIDTDSGSYWHGIIHRREPDYGNAKYWFRRVGEHAIFAPLRAEAAGIIQSEYTIGEAPAAARFLTEGACWDAFRFVDFCQQATADRRLELLCRKVAQAEWRLLFDDCYRRSIA